MIPKVTVRVIKIAIMAPVIPCPDKTKKVINPISKNACNNSIAEYRLICPNTLNEPSATTFSAPRIIRGEAILITKAADSSFRKVVAMKSDDKNIINDAAVPITATTKNTVITP